MKASESIPTSVPWLEPSDTMQMHFLVQAVWESAVDAMALSDPNGTVLAVNPAYCELYGRPIEDLVGHSFAIIFPEAQRAEAEHQYRRYFAETIDPQGVESTVEAGDGQERRVEVRYSFIEHGGQRIAMLSVIRDVTERVRLQQSERDLLREKDHFLLTVSHDLKSPLTAIKGQAQLLRRRLRMITDLDPSILAEGLSQIETSAIRMTTMIDGLLDASTLQRGDALPLHRSSVDLVALIRQVVAERDVAIERARIAVDAPEAVNGWWDEPRLRQVVDNLLNNALKYSPEGGTVRVSVCEVNHGNQSEAVLSVRDAGIGIPQDNLERIFEPFYRATNVGAEMPGSGIGLASVRQIVEMHEGTISVESVEGEGSTFTVRLPLQVPLADR